MTFGHHLKGAWVVRTDSGYRRDRLYARGVDVVYFSPLDPGAAAHMAATRSEGRIPGLYTDPHWYGLAGDGHAVAYRQLLDADIARLLKPGEPYCVDLEFISLDYVRRLFLGSPGNRGLLRSGNSEKPQGSQLGRPVRYTNMPFQNHTVVPMDVFATCAELHWVPQLYYGDMAIADTVAVCMEVVRELEFYTKQPAGARVHPFYDGAKYASDQRDGDYFTAERFPGMFGLGERVLGDAAERRILTKEELRQHYTHMWEVNNGSQELRSGESVQDNGRHDER